MKQTNNNNSIYWLGLCGLTILLQREFNIHTYNTVCLLVFPSLYVITTWHTIPDLSKRIHQAILISLVSFCFFGEKTLISFILPFIASFASFVVYAAFERYCKKQSNPN